MIVNLKTNSSMNTNKRINLFYESSKKKSFANGFTLVELIVVTALMGFLVSISVPSTLSWIYREKEKSYQRELTGYLNLIRRESRRWGGACNFSLKTVSQSKDEKGFKVTCQGINKAARNNIDTLMPVLSKHVFHEINYDMNITPKGQISIPSAPSNVTSVVIIVGGRHKHASGNQQPKCIVIQSPSGSIRSGIYDTAYKYFPSRTGSSYNRTIIEQRCKTL